MQLKPLVFINEVQANQCHVFALESSITDIPGMDQYQKSPYAELLHQFKLLFAANQFDFGRTHIVQHTIPLMDDTPVKQRAYRCPIKLQEELDQQITELLEHNIIEPSSSPWAAPVLLVKKKNGKYRLCVDYRKLNNQTRKDSYPLPRIDDILAKFKNAKYFSSLDMVKGYHQIEMADDDKEKTAFIVDHGLYQYSVMPFGLTGAPNTFQRLMDHLFQGLKFVLVYLDDIVVFSETITEHINHLYQVFNILIAANLKLNLEKCQLGREQIDFLGHHIDAHGISPDKTLIEKVQNFAVPTSIKQVQSFLGLASYYRKFIKNFSHIARPLTQLLQKDIKFCWNETHQESFETLKMWLVTPPILIYPDISKPFIVQTDASKFAIGGILSQLDENGYDHPIAYISRTLNKAEKNYSTIERECLAIVHACENFRHFLYGSAVTIITDHAPLQWLSSHKNTSSRLLRWALRLQDLKMNITYKPGRKHTNADALSRMINIISLSVDIPQMQKDDAFIANLRQTIQPPYILKDDVLYYSESEKLKLVLPDNLQKMVMFEAHDSLIGAHLGAKRMMLNIKKAYFWPQHGYLC